MTTLDVTFTATLRKSPNKGGWTYVVMHGSADYFATRGLDPICGQIDGHPLHGSFMALGNGTHKPGVPADIPAQIGKQAGDTVTVVLEERFALTPTRSTP